MDQTILMRLGKQEIALVGLKPPGRPYPIHVAGWNPLFQHIAIVVSNMATAYREAFRLSRVVTYLDCGTADSTVGLRRSQRIQVSRSRRSSAGTDRLCPECHPSAVASTFRELLPRYRSFGDFGCEHVEQHRFL